jgi:hypothetical protein
LKTARKNKYMTFEYYVGRFVRCLFPRRGIVMTAAVSAILLSGPLLAQSQWSGTSPGPTYYSGGNVGIGTTNPGSPLTVVNGGGPISAAVFQGDSIYGAQLTLAGKTNGDLQLFLGYNTTTNVGTNQSIYQDVGMQPLALNPHGGNVGIGTATPVHLLHVAGTIGAEEVIVSSTGADYVFAPDYHLRDLSEVAAFIQENHHLPDIPSEAEVREKGIGVGEMQTKLLAKIEELTLHMIQAEQTNNELKQQNRELLDRVTRLEKPEGK